MSQSSTYEYGPGNGEAQEQRRHRSRWRPLEVAAVILGFIVFWPLGLGLLMWKLWRSKNGQSADIVQAARNLEEKVMNTWPEKARRWGCSSRREATNWSQTNWGFSSAARGTGNAAFDNGAMVNLRGLKKNAASLRQPSGNLPITLKACAAPRTVKNLTPS